MKTQLRILHLYNTILAAHICVNKVFDGNKDFHHIIINKYKKTICYSIEALFYLLKIQYQNLHQDTSIHLTLFRIVCQYKVNLNISCFFIC